ncbi:MAG TPA: hydroxyacylglutathione hydrolase [Micropepsaceae bacterium]|nr:hydroxyacylglutathione hydrolase [Micropepsaceae bacterium]
MQITIIPCLSDNYAYLIETHGAVGVVDPSEEAPVVAALEKRGLRLTHILNTHHHFDHTGGNVALKARYGASIIGPEADRHRIPGLDQGVTEGEAVMIGDAKAAIISIPAHTSGHIAFHFSASGDVFTGDTLFAMGCGRLFEGTPDDMWRALSKLAALPPHTRVWCGHEYTQSNGRFALTVDGGNSALHARMEAVNAARARNMPTMPSTIGDEIATNPFMRAKEPALAAACAMTGKPPAEVLGEIRRRKDSFR